MIHTPSFSRQEPKSLPAIDPRFPGLRFVKGNPRLKKTDPAHKDRIVTDDDLAFDIFAPTPDPALLQQGKQVELIDIQPFDEYCQGVLLFDMEWVGFDGGPANGDKTDVIVAIGAYQNGHYAIACNPDKTEKQLIQWFYQLLDKWNPHTLGGHAIYGFYKGDTEVLSDLGLLAARSKHHGLHCPWTRSTKPERWRWTNAKENGQSMEAPAWDCDRFQLIDTLQQTALWDSIFSKLSGYGLKVAVREMGLVKRDDRLDIGADVWRYWRDGDTETIAKYLRQDLEDTALLWHKLIPAKYFQRAYMPMTLQRICTTGTGSWWNQYLRMVNGADYAPGCQTAAYQGAITFYYAGVWRDCVKLDFGAMYPNIIEWLQLCPHNDHEKMNAKTVAFVKRFRKQLQAKLKDLKKSTAEYNNIDGQQATAKVLGNSDYGLFNTMGLQFNDPYVGAMVTWAARQLTRFVIQCAIDDGCVVVGCLTQETLVMTDKGTFPIIDLIDHKVNVLNKDCRWVPVTFTKRMEDVPIYEVTLKRNREIQTIRCDAGHRWYASTYQSDWRDRRYKFYTTADMIGKKWCVPNMLTPKPNSDNIDYNNGVIHGIVYGDGNRHMSHEVRSGKESRLGKQFMCQLVNGKMELLPYFRTPDQTIANVRSEFADTNIVESVRVNLYSSVDLKAVPDDSVTDSYLLGFFRGLITTDGSVDNRDGTVDISGSKDTIDYVDKMADRVGFRINRLNISNKGGRTTIIRGRECTQKEDCWRAFFAVNCIESDDLLRSFHHDKWLTVKNKRTMPMINSDWQIVDIKVTGDREDVYCCTEPQTHTFTLHRGLLSGNCDTDGIQVYHPDHLGDKRNEFFTQLTQTINDALPGNNYIDYEDDIDFIWIPKVTGTKSVVTATQKGLDDKTAFIKNNPLHGETVGLSKNYITMTRKKDGTISTTKKGKFKKRNRSWLDKTFVETFLLKWFDQGLDVACDYYYDVRGQIADGVFPLERLQENVLVAKNWTTYEEWGFTLGEKYLTHYVYDEVGSKTKAGKPRKHKQYKRTDDVSQPYSREYYCDKIDELYMLLCGRTPDILLPVADHDQLQLFAA